MILGYDALATVPLGWAAVEGGIDTTITPSSAEIVFAGGTPFVVVVEGPIDPYGIDAALIAFSSGTTRIGDVLRVTGASWSLSGGMPVIGKAIVPLGNSFALLGGDPTVSSLIAVVSAGVSFASGDPIVGSGFPVSAAEITFAGGMASISDSFLPAAAALVISSGNTQLGDGLAVGAGEFAFAGGTPSLGTALKPGFAILWFSGGVMPETVEAAQGIIVVLNANTLAVSEYNIAALDVLEYEGEVYFVTATGLSKLADGAGVSGTITTGDLELSDGSISLNLARLELEADGELHITATAHQDGGQRTTRYLVPKRTGTNERDRNVKLGNGVLGNDWSFTIAPPTGQVCNWSLGGWKIEPGQYKLRRR